MRSVILKCLCCSCPPTWENSFSLLLISYMPALIHVYNIHTYICIVFSAWCTTRGAVASIISGSNTYYICIKHFLICLYVYICKNIKIRVSATTLFFLLVQIFNRCEKGFYERIYVWRLRLPRVARDSSFFSLSLLSELYLLYLISDEISIFALWNCNFALEDRKIINYKRKTECILIKLFDSDKAWWMSEYII